MKRKNINSHLTLEARLFIEDELNKGSSILDISNQLDRDGSNISREIARNKILIKPGLYNDTSCCIHKTVCKKVHYGCEETCDNFELDICDKLKASPHVCNNCPNKHCRKAKYYYKGKKAQEQYLKKLSESRTKLHYTETELNILNNDFYCLVINTKSIYHSIKVINSTGYNFNCKTIYRQIKDDRLRLKTSDLPRANHKKKEIVVDRNYKRDISGHTHEDYITKIKQEPNITEWQMDCVQGIQGKNEQVFLTLQIVKIKFLFIFPIKSQTKVYVLKRLNLFNGILEENKLNKLIELLLTDNGHEFIDLESLIKVIGNNNIYYCHPYSSFEKGSIENNHELIRRVIPKGVSLNAYSENDINLLSSHINSLYREELGGKCPFDLLNEYITEDTIKKIGYKKIEAKEVKLIPELLGDKNVQNIKKYLTPEEIKKANIKFIN